MRFVFSFLIMVLSVNLLAVTPQEVLAKAAELSKSYDFESEEGGMLSSWHIGYMNYSNGIISRSVGDKEVMFRGDCQRPTGTKIRLLQNPEGNFVVVDLPEKFAIKMISKNSFDSILPILTKRFDTLQTILEEGGKLPLKDFKEVNKSGIDCYYIKLDIAKKQSIRNNYKNFMPFDLYEVELFIGKDNYFVYCWQIRHRNNDNLEINDLGKAKVMPGGSLDRKKFLLENGVKTLEAEDIYSYIDILCRRGKDPDEEDATATDIRSADVSVADFITYNSRLFSLSFVVLAILTTVVGVVVYKRRK